jgi:hypothetical protein
MTIADVFPHGGLARSVPSLTDLQSGLNSDGTVGPDPILTQITAPGGRPEVYLRGTNYALTVGAVPVPVGPHGSVDYIIVDTPSGAANSVFFGFGNGVSTASGLEVRAGIPLIWQPDNTREMWELQRVVEYIAVVVGAINGIPSLPPYKAPRVILDPSQWFVVASASTNISIALVYVPEMQ